MSQHMNPRVALWLQHAGLTEASVARRSGEDVPMVTVGRARLPWTVHYSMWIIGKWNEWATSLGFRGPDAHVAAMRSGHTSDDFDDWLQRSVVQANPCSSSGNYPGNLESST